MDKWKPHKTKKGMLPKSVSSATWMSFVFMAEFISHSKPFFNSRHISFFKFLFDAVSLVKSFPPIILPVDRNITASYKYTYEKYFTVYHFTYKIINATEAKGFYINMSNKVFIQMPYP